MWRGAETVWLTPDQLERRASGRRHYNSWRQFLALSRRCEVVKLLAQGMPHGVIAAYLGVSAKTIGRDVTALMQGGRDGVYCPACQRPYAIRLPDGYPG